MQACVPCPSIEVLVLPASQGGRVVCRASLGYGEVLQARHAAAKPNGTIASRRKAVHDGHAMSAGAGQLHAHAAHVPATSAPALKCVPGGGTLVQVEGGTVF